MSICENVRDEGREQGGKEERNTLLCGYTFDSTEFLPLGILLDPMSNTVRFDLRLI